MESNSYNTVFKKLTEINSESQIIRGDQQFADFLGMGIATYRRHAREIPHRVVGKVRISSKEALLDWLSGRLQWPPATENQSSTPSVSVPRAPRKGGAK